MAPGKQCKFHAPSPPSAAHKLLVGPCRDQLKLEDSKQEIVNSPSTRCGLFASVLRLCKLLGMSATSPLSSLKDNPLDSPDNGVLILQK